jgi:hypothetical protein
MDHTKIYVCVSNCGFNLKGMDDKNKLVRIDGDEDEDKRRETREGKAGAL